MSRIVLVFLVLASLACSLTSSDGNDPTAIPIRTSIVTPSATSNITPSPTIALTSTPSQSTTTGGGGTGSGSRPATAAAPPTVTNCSPRSDWFLYTVQAGDTLGEIADAAGSTSNDLTQANCLANPDSIAVGQQLRVPSLPGSNTGGSTGSNTGGSTGSNTGGSTGSNTGGTTGSTTGGSTTGGNTAGGSTGPTISSPLTIQPVLNVSGVGIVTLQATIALNVGVVSEADTVRFYAGISSSDTSPVNIATDVDPFDGTPVEYTFNEFDDILYFWAVAENEFGATESQRVAVTYDPTYNPNAGSGNSAVSISPYVGFDGSLYTLSANTTVTVLWAAPANTTQVDFLLAPNGSGFSVIGSDSSLGDGAAISWAVPDLFLGQMMARATLSNGTTQDSVVVNVYSE
jgi:LysM repeat protein